MLVEIIATNLEEALLAEQYGANRIELIHSFELGGLSPEKELIRDICEAVKIPVNVMVRPHGESFVFSAKDMQQVYNEIDYIASNTQANAIVFGTLDSVGAINFAQLESVLRFIEPSQLQLTFHRAIDESNDVLKNFNLLVTNFSDTKLSKVLTSGGEDSAIKGSEVISAMVKLANGGNIEVLAGAGITPENARNLISLTQVTEIHLGTGVRSNNQLNSELFTRLLTNISS